MIQISNKSLILVCFAVIAATFVFGWSLGRLARDNASQTFLHSQNEVIKEYLYDLDRANKEILKDEIVIATQKDIMKESFVKKEELDSIFLIQKTKLVQIEKKIEQIQERQPIIIILPIRNNFNGTLLAEKFREQNNNYLVE